MINYLVINHGMMCEQNIKKLVQRVITNSLFNKGGLSVSLHRSWMRAYCRSPPVNNARSGGICSPDSPACDAQYPSYKIKEFPATIVRLLYPHPRNTNARLRMSLQKFACHQFFFSIFLRSEKQFLYVARDTERGKLHSFVGEQREQWVQRSIEYCFGQR